MNHQIIKTPEKQIPVCRVIKKKDGGLLLEFKGKKQFEIVSKQWLEEEIYRILRSCPRSHDL